MLWELWCAVFMELELCKISKAFGDGTRKIEIRLQNENQDGRELKTSIPDLSKAERESPDWRAKTASLLVTFCIVLSQQLPNIQPKPLRV